MPIRHILSNPERATTTLALCLLLGAPAATLAQAAGGATAAPHYDIAPGPLDSRLNLFARSARIALSFTPAQVRGRISPGLQGSFAPQAGLARLLAGTGLAVRATPAGYVLEQATDAAAPATAPPDAAIDPAMAPVEVRAAFTGPRPEDEAYRQAGSSSYLSRDDIERSRGSSVGDIFKGTTGVLIGENRNSGGLDVNIRGMQGQGRVPVLVDGARQETTVWRGYSGVASRSYIDPDLIGGIRVDKGPTLSAQGTGATGGLVSMRTIGAEDIVRAGQTFGLRLRGQAIGNNSGSPVASGTPAGLFTGRFPSGTEAVYRSDCVNAALCASPYALPEDWGHPDGRDRPGTLSPQSWAGSLSAAWRRESADFVAAYAQRRQGNYYAGTHGPSAWMDLSDRRRRPFYTEVRPVIRGASPFEAGERIPGTNFESRSALLKGTLYLPGEQELELGYLRYDSAYSELMPSQIVRLGSLEPVLQPQDSDVRADTYTARYHWNPQDRPLIDLRAGLWHTRTRSTNNNPGNEALADLFISELQRYARTGLDLENTASLAHGRWGTSQLRYGLSAQWEDMHSDPLTLDVNETYGRAGDRAELSVFAAWQYKPWSTVVLDAGLRHARFRSKDDRPITIRDPASPYCVDADGDGACDPVESRNRRSGTTPVLSLSWEPGNAGLQLYGRYAEAMRMPSLFESTAGFSFDAAPDVPLRPERARNREIGLNYARDGLLAGRDRLRLKFAYFDNRTDDYLTRTSANLWEEGGQDPYRLTMRNIDSAAFRGMELSGSYDAGIAFTEFGVTRYDRIEICHTGSYRAERCNDYGIANSYINNMVPPKWHGNLTLGTRLLQGRLTLGVRGIFMGQRKRTPDYNDDTARGLLAVVPWHAYRVFDLFVSYQASERVSLDFNLDNFTDRYYLDALGLGLVPAPGRSARLGVTLRF